MDYNQLIQDVTYAILLVLSTYMVTYITKYLNEKKQMVKDKQLLSDAIDIINSAVIKTNQTYVNELKGKNLFDSAKQREAFNMAKNTATLLLSNEIKEMMDRIYKDPDAFINMMIETCVSRNK